MKLKLFAIIAVIAMIFLFLVGFQLLYCWMERDMFWIRLRLKKKLRLFIVPYLKIQLV